DVTVDDIIATMNRNVELARRVVASVVTAVSETRDCICSHSLENAIITSRDAISPEVRERLGIIIKRYVK
ncbi:MAG: S-methyl-5'-thioadenosine phosphorylase, partial [Candidatus Dadabacteria bacterium]|nr:S-methyl-5'-thioadenosine phosphorylase [Candidatus Dadabacteria bacterium]